MKKLIFLILLFASPGWCATYNATNSANLLTALAACGDGDTINVAAGTYDLDGYSRTFNFALDIVGADEATTIIEDGGIFYFDDDLDVSDITFQNWRGDYVFQVAVASGDTMTGASFTDCTFDGMDNAIATTTLSLVGSVSNFTVDDCTFQNLIGSGLVGAVRLHTRIVGYSGNITNVTVTNNTITNLNSTAGGEVAGIQIGSNQSRYRITTGVITGNTISTLRGATSNECHGIIAYGDGFTIDNNTVSDILTKEGHEGIYGKIRNSTINSNTLTDAGGYTDGMIALKAADWGINNSISNNIIRSNTSAYRGIGSYGNATISNNAIIMPNGRGMFHYGYGLNYTISYNSVTSYGDALYLGEHPYGYPGYASTNSTVNNNCFASYYGDTIDDNAVTGGVTFTSNSECNGTNCNCEVAIVSADLIKTGWSSETDVQTTGGTFTFTLANSTWAETIGSDNPITTAFCTAFNSAGNLTTGSTNWNDVISIDYTNVTRESDNVTLTVVVPARVTYDIASPETVSIVIPSDSTSAGTTITCPTFYISYVTENTVSQGMVVGGNRAILYLNGGRNILLKE